MHEAVRFALRSGRGRQPASPLSARPPGTAATVPPAARRHRRSAGRPPSSRLGPDRQGAGDRPADRARAVEPRHRRGARHQPGNRRPARRQHPRQARPQLPRAGRRLDRRPAGLRRTRTRPAELSRDRAERAGAALYLLGPGRMCMPGRELRSQRRAVPRRLAAAVRLHSPPGHLHSGMGNSADVTTVATFPNVFTGTLGHRRGRPSEGDDRRPVTCVRRCRGAQPGGPARGAPAPRLMPGA